MKNEITEIVSVYSEYLPPDVKERLISELTEAWENEKWNLESINER